MLTRFCLLIVVITSPVLSNAQVIIHSHNDYIHAKPFWEAYQNKAGVIEADVFAVNNQLMVAHSKDEIDTANTLQHMYIEPIVQLFHQHNNYVSADSNYTFYLMIDVKENWQQVLPLLLKTLNQYPSVFNRTKNKKAIQVFISGERPPDSLFASYPSEIMFDGLPAKSYSDAELNKIVMISDDFKNSSQWSGIDSFPSKDKNALIKIISVAHAQNKPVRFWGAPDTQLCWSTLTQLGAYVINTDKVKECREFLNKNNH